MNALSRCLSILTQPFERRSRVDPMKPHQFRSIDAVAAMGVGSGPGMQQGASQAALFALAADAERGRCRLAGCGKPVNDPLHL
jgi:hypothetical protein